MSPQLYIVELDDQRDERLAGHTGCSYTSPPQPEPQALALIRALLGCPPQSLDLTTQHWHVPVAGGQRVIHVHAANHDGQLTIDAPTATP